MANNNSINSINTANYVIVGAGASGYAAVSPTSTSGAILQSNGLSSAPTFSTASYPSTATGTGTILRANGTNWAATTATYPTTTTVSQILYSSSANVISGLATANSSVLVTNGSGVPAWGSGATVGSSVVLVQSQTASDSAALSFTGLNQGQYYVQIINTYPATSTANLLCEISNDNGSTWLTTGYASGLNYSGYTTSVITNANGTANFILSGPMLNTSANQASFNVYIGPTSVGDNISINGSGIWNDTTVGNAAFGQFGGRAGTGINAIRFRMSSGNITAGIYSLYYYKIS